MGLDALYRDAAAPVLSFEVYPPRTPEGLEPLYGVVEELAEYRPGFVSVTYGAGGSTRDTTLTIAGEIVRRFDVPVTSHLTCVGATRDDLRRYLGEAARRGVSGVMALRGDPPKGEEKFVAVAEGLSYACDLVELVRAEFPQFGIGVAGYPETHQEAASPEDDVRRLAHKVRCGGQAVFTQLFYDNADYFRFVDRCRAAGITTPIIPGLLPICSYNQIKRITQLCKARLPEDLVDQLEDCQDDAAAQVSVGVEHARQQAAELLARGVPGIHFYVLNRSDAMHRILDGLATGAALAAA